ncbi:MAG: long-chain fatty acid--CoA ligase [Nitriliruptorales bacterium]|nr:long-chain fatty acid--CoA ligase [Nitriliruptorales bacterium]
MEATTLPARLRQTADRYGDRPALLWQSEARTYAELDAAVDAGAVSLRRLDVQPGDRVALVLGNVPAFVEAYYAVLRAGAVAVPLNPGSTEDELQHALSDSGAVAVVVRAGLRGVVAGLAGELDALRHIVLVGEPPEGAPELPRWGELVAEGRGEAPPEGLAGSDDLAALIYTSGTTGRPRGAMLTHHNLTANQDQSLAGRFTIEPDDQVLVVLPLFHIYALNVGLGASLKVGAAVVLLERFDPAGSLEAIAEHEVSIILGAPPMYVAWLNTPGAGEALGTARLAVSGAAALPVQVLERFRELVGTTIQEGYGLTEAGPSVTSNAMAEQARPGSVGLPLPDIELRLVDDEGRDVRQGDPGEILVRGPNVFRGYWNDDDATTAALTDDGWLRTGDIGTLDEDGFLFVVDRKKDMIIVSGFNVYPREVERALYRHDGVGEAAVVGVPHPYTGEAVRAYVVPRPGAALTEDDLIDHCGRFVARYKCPTSVELVDELPHTATGKIRRVELREEK